MTNINIDLLVEQARQKALEDYQDQQAWEERIKLAIEDFKEVKDYRPDLHAIYMDLYYKNAYDEEEVVTRLAEDDPLAFTGFEHALMQAQQYKQK